MFIVILKYIKPLEQVDLLIPAHVEFLKKGYQKREFICSGRRNPRVGGVIVVNVDNEQKVKDLIKEDPFYIHEVAQYEVIEFLPNRYDERFACFVENRKDS